MRPCRVWLAVASRKTRHLTNSVLGGRQQCHPKTQERATQLCPPPILADLSSSVHRQAIGQLDKANADVEALERLASFLGTLFVKHDITATDEQVLAAAAKRRPKLKGENACIGLYLCFAAERGEAEIQGCVREVGARTTA